MNRNWIIICSPLASLGENAELSRERLPLASLGENQALKTDAPSGHGLAPHQMQKGDYDMAVPDYQSIMLPLLRFVGEKNDETSTGEAVEVLAKEFGLTDEDLREMLPSGIQSNFVNRVGWASTYMKKAGLLEATRRGYFRITPRGQELLKKQPKAINVKLLKQYPEFLEFQQLKGTRSGDREGTSRATLDVTTITPSEALEAAYENLRDELADELLTRLKKSSPSFFE